MTASPRPRSTATRASRSASARSTTSRPAGSRSWSPPRSPRAASTSRRCRTSSTSSCRWSPRTTSTASAAPAGPASTATPSRSSASTSSSCSTTSSASSAAGSRARPSRASSPIRASARSRSCVAGSVVRGPVLDRAEERQGMRVHRASVAWPTAPAPHDRLARLSRPSVRGRRPVRPQRVRARTAHGPAARRDPATEAPALPDHADRGRGSATADHAPPVRTVGPDHGRPAVTQHRAPTEAEATASRIRRARPSCPVSVSRVRRVVRRADPRRFGAAGDAVTAATHLAPSSAAA